MVHWVGFIECADIRRNRMLLDQAAAHATMVVDNVGVAQIMVPAPFDERFRMFATTYDAAKLGNANTY
jgi:hypothetical protein